MTTSILVSILRLPLAAAFLLAVTVACGSTAGSSATGAPSAGLAHSSEAQKCDTDGRPLVEGYSKTLTLVAALPTTAGAAAHWEMTKNGPMGHGPSFHDGAAFQQTVACSSATSMETLPITRLPVQWGTCGFMNARLYS